MATESQGCGVQVAVEQATVSSQQKEYVALVSSVQESCRKGVSEWLNFIVYLYGAFGECS
jgi:hypothetical protein